MCHIERDGVADVDEVVGGGAQALLRHQLFLKQFFTGTQAGVFHLNVHIRLEARQLDEVAGQCVDLHRGAHVQHEDLAALRVGAGLQDQTHRLGDGHEIADDVRVGHCDRPAMGDLLFEQRDDAAVAAQHVAEAHRHKLGAGLAHRDRAADLADVLRVDEQLRDLVCSPLFYHPVEGLDDHLAQALAGAHDVGGVDRLIGGNQNKSLAAVGHGGVGRLISTDHVVLDGFAGTDLHQRHMLVSRRVVHDLGLILFKHMGNAAAVPH